MNKYHRNQPNPKDVHRAKQAIYERFIEHCRQTGEDPSDEGKFEDFKETHLFYETMSKDDLAGYMDNMNK